MVQIDPKREWRFVRYASGNFGKNLVWSTADLTLLFILTDLIELPTSSAALLMTIAFAGDLVFDVLAGAISARAKIYAAGIRRLITLGAVPCGAAFMLLYALPWWGEHRFWIIACLLLLFRATFALVDLPHYALIASITTDSRARGRTAGYRSFFSNISSLVIATAVVPLVESSARAGDAVPLAAFGACAGIMYRLVMASAAMAGAPIERFGNSSNATPASRLSVPQFDPLFLAMLPIAVVMGFAVPMFSRTVIYYSTYVLARPALASQILTAITLGQFAGVAVWTSLIRRFDKTTLLLASLVASLVTLCMFAASAPNQSAMLIAAALMGVALLGIYMLPWGILPDVVDFCELRQGFRQETTLFAIFLVVHKASGAAAASLIGWVLAITGYVPGAQQSPLVVSAILFLSFGIPIVGAMVAVATLLPLDIGHRRHAAAIRKLQKFTRTVPLVTRGKAGST